MSCLSAYHPCCVVRLQSDVPSIHSCVQNEEQWKSRCIPHLEWFFFNSGLSVWLFTSLQATIKLVPRSDLSTLDIKNIFLGHWWSLTGHNEAWWDMLSITSMWMALVPKQVNNTAHLLLSALPSLVCAKGQFTLSWFAPLSFLAAYDRWCIYGWHSRPASCRRWSKLQQNEELSVLVSYQYNRYVTATWKNVWMRLVFWPVSKRLAASYPKETFLIKDKIQLVQWLVFENFCPFSSLFISSLKLSLCKHLRTITFACDCSSWSSSLEKFWPGEHVLICL